LVAIHTLPRELPSTEASIFTTTLEKTDPAERTAFLAATCGSDISLRKRIEGLFAAPASKVASNYPRGRFSL